MTHPNSNHGPAALPQPLSIDPTRHVEATYPLPVPTNLSQPTPDAVTTDRLEAFLVDRHTHQPRQNQRGYIEVPLPPTDHKRPGFGEGKLFWPGIMSRRVTAVALLATAALNIGDNYGNISHAGYDVGVGVGKGIEAAVDWISDTFGGSEQSAVPAQPAGPTETVIPAHAVRTQIRIRTATSNSDQPSKADIAKAERVLAAQAKVASSVDVTEQTITSDDFRADPNLGLTYTNQGNEAFGARLQASTSQALKAGVTDPKIHLKTADPAEQEHVLQPAEVKSLEQVVANNGITSLSDALNTYDADPQQLPTAVRAKFDEFIGKYRGTMLSVTAHIPAKTVPNSEPSQTPTNPSTPDSNEPGETSLYKHVGWRGDYWNLVPLLGLIPLGYVKPRWKTITKQHSVRVPTPGPQAEYLKLYPGALRPVGGVSRPQESLENRELVQAAWAYDRKYQNLLREPGRIQGVFSHTYEDATGQQQTLRAMFIDHEPTTESLAMFMALFSKISQFGDGRIGKDLSMVAVYPTANTGKHGDPKKVGMGQEVQYESNTLGIAIPSIGLVEMHMPAKPTEEEVWGYTGAYVTSMQQVLHNFDAAAKTAAHEAGGHFTDLNAKPNMLEQRRPRTAHTPAVFSLPNRFEDSAAKIYQQLKRDRAAGKPLQWTIRQRLVDANGTIREETDTIELGDRMRARLWRRLGYRAFGWAYPTPVSRDTRNVLLTRAAHIRKESFPNSYSSGSAGELYAESAADATFPQMGIPLSTEPETQQVVPVPGYAHTYHAPTVMHQHLTQRWGADPTKDELTFSRQPVVLGQSYGPLTSDELLTGLAYQARQTPLPAELDLLHVVTGVRLHRHKSNELSK